MIDYRARRKRIEQFRFVAICLCIIAAIIFLFGACTPHVDPRPRPIPADTLRVHVVLTDTTRKVVTIYDTTHTPIVVWDTTHTPITQYDTTRIPIVVHDTSHNSVSVYDTTHVPVVRYDTTVKYDTTHANIALVDTIRTTVQKQDTVHYQFVIWDTVYWHLKQDTIKPPPVILPTDTVQTKLILPVDTVYMRVGDPPISFQYGDSIKIPIRVLPRCTCSMPIDTVAHVLTQGLTPAQAGVDTIGIHIYDWPTRSGDNSVYLNAQFVGRIMQDNNGNWIVYRSQSGTIVMPADSVPYPSKLEALKAFVPK